MKVAFCIIGLLLMEVQFCLSQNLVVEKCVEMPNDSSTYVLRFVDLNNSPCALLKVHFPITGATFEGNVIGGVLSVGDEYWVNCTDATQMIRIKVPGYNSLLVSFPSYGIRSLQSNRVYALAVNVQPAIQSNEDIGECLFRLGKNQLDMGELGNAVTFFLLGEIYGNQQALHQLGLCYTHGDGVKTDLKRAFQYFSRAASMGYDKSQYCLGICYENGDGVPIDYHAAFDWYMKSAVQNNANAIYAIAKCYSLGKGVHQDKNKGIEWFKKAAALGDASSMNELGSIYENGDGVNVDYKAAFNWYKKAAERNIDGICNLGIMYMTGKGIECDYEKAFQLFSNAVFLENKHARSLYLLAFCYAYGYGIMQNEKYAFNLFSQASDLGSMEAKFQLTNFYREGRGGVEINYKKAFELCKESAEAGIPLAQTALGLYYILGEGVEEDYNEGIKWLQKAADNGETNAKDFLEKDKMLP